MIDVRDDDYTKTLDGRWVLTDEARERRLAVTPPKERKETESREASFLNLNRCLYEQIYLDGNVAFIEYDGGQVSTVTHVMDGPIRVVPLSSEEIALGAVKLPSGVEEYGDLLRLLSEVDDHLFRYLDVSDKFRKFACYYIVLSWVYDRFNTLPYLRFIGDTGVGKSRALDVVGGLCYKRIQASGCITPAPIYRMLKRWGGTVILDEADLQNSDEYHEVIKILNCGFERDRAVIRAVKDNPDKLQFLPTFGPKVFATRRRFKDAALEARCLTEVMTETSRADIPPTLPTAFYTKQDELRNKLLLFRLRNYYEVNSEVALDLPGIEFRLRQVSACFGSLFANEPAVMDDYRAFIGQHQRELIEQRAATKVGQVVEKLMELVESDTFDTFDTFDTHILSVSAGDIAGKLGSSWTPQGVGQILRTLGLETKLVKAQRKRCIVYDQAKLETLRKRYIPSEEESMVSMVSIHGDPVPGVDTVNEASCETTTLRRCPNCGGKDFWLTSWGDWLCGRCHPRPLEER